MDDLGSVAQFDNGLVHLIGIYGTRIIGDREFISFEIDVDVSNTC